MEFYEVQNCWFMMNKASCVGKTIVIVLNIEKYFFLKFKSCRGEGHHILSCVETLCLYFLWVEF